MATVSSLGVGSGLDLNSLLTNLMTAEQQPLLDMQKKEASFQTRISSLGTLKGALSALQTTAIGFIPSSNQSLVEKFATFKAATTDTTIASATATTGAVSGNYSLEISALAQNQRLTSSAGLNTISTGGTLKIELGKQATTGTPPTTTTTYTADSTRELNITIANGATIESVRDAINAAATDGRVSATIVNGTAGKQLVLTSGQTGLANVMKLSGITDLNFDPTYTSTSALSEAAANGGQAASDASFKIGGIAATSSTNSVTGVIDGVTLSLLKTNVGTPITMTVTRDSTTALTSAINGFVKAYNDAAASIKSLGYYDANTKKAGTLQGDSTLRGAQNQIRNLLSTKAGGNSAFQTLSDIGISLQKDGTLSLDSTKLNAATTNDFAGVADLVSKVGTAFKSGLEGLVGTSGNITAATDSANRMIKDLTKREAAFSDRLTQIEARYRKQFSSLDTLVASMNKTSTYLTQQLANLPGASSSSK